MLNCLYSSDNRKKKQVEDAGLIRCYGFLLTNTLDTSSVDNCLVLFCEREKILYVLMVLFTLFFCKRLFNICLKITYTSVSDERLLELLSGCDASTLMRSSKGE